MATKYPSIFNQDESSMSYGDFNFGDYGAKSVANMYSGLYSSGNSIPLNIGNTYTGGTSYNPTSNVFNPVSQVSDNTQDATKPSSNRGSSFTPYSVGFTETPYSYQTGTKTTQYGAKDYSAALTDWEKVYKDAQQGIPAAKDLINQFAVGGSYGKGQRADAEQAIKAGLSKDIGMNIASGNSSMSGSRGLNTLAGRELSKRYSNIDDQRAALQVQAFTPYTQMLSNLGSIGTARPTRNQYVNEVTNPTFTTGSKLTPYEYYGDKPNESSVGFNN